MVCLMYFFMDLSHQDDAQLARILQEEENARSRQTAQPPSHVVCILFDAHELSNA